MDIHEAKTAVSKLIDDQADALWALSLAIHADPELSLEEHRAANRLCVYLEENGFSLIRGVANLPTAFRADRPAADEEKPSVSFLSEYDALPGLGHACAHNVIGVAGAAAGVALKETLGPEYGGVTVFGTPGEEGGGGKVLMAQTGMFREVDAAMMMHPSDETRADINLLALSELRFHFKGRASHASAAPEQGVNALDALIATFGAVSLLRQQLHRTDRVHGVITEGGEAPNIIPDKASAWFFVRSETMEGLDALVPRVIACAEGAALATGAELETEKNPITYAPMRVNPPLAALFLKNLNLLGVHEPDAPPPLRMGSSDVGNVSQHTPTIHPQIQMVPPGVSAHTPEFAEASAGEEGRRVLLTGAKALAMTGVDFLLDEEARRSVQSEFESREA
ncbi:MAG: M20 family metallopeptidase [Nitrospinae bacterium]|nr:M20 family metallopeptidase [Nitrospinota bacterium]